ncbi:FtsX-like permease family protein [Pseudodesulfovibrio sp. F-1]|uniref:FtsX-like permease family protein n=1 Tax=Pseudodesulfovibrio alkaliphilus TaxID=2661613 RepID=A0A7K1KR84_9BACT|nr:ABC transporter permease [Pseudodesulfovibrio alkaliphilus]MUM78480.1 FtsX-like permease family protein [Pseudodesulfovibrio alkaliphilus]
MRPILAYRTLQLAISSLWRFRLRSVLIVSAVALAITALTIIVATMEGAERKADELAVMFGPTAVNVLGADFVGQRLGRSSMTLTWSDVRALEDHLPNVEHVSPYLYRVGAIVQANGKTLVADSLSGSGEDHWLHWSWPLHKGLDFTVDDVRLARRVCFLGDITAQGLFGDQDPIGETVLVDSIPFTVKGVHAPLGMASDGVQVDNRITVPITTMAGRFNISHEHLFQLRVTFPAHTPESAMPSRVESVRSVLRESHGLSDTQVDDFILYTAGDVLQFISILKGGVVLFLGITVLAAILVSGFVLANLFHLSVAERQEEIGLKKALGANRFSILLQIMLEALLLCIAGAALGLVIGLFISHILERFGFLIIALSLQLFVWAFVGACGIGFFFALRPARNAAAMPAVQALRRGA